MSSKIAWPKRSQDDQPPTINDGRSTTDLSDEINRLNRKQPGTNMSRNIIYECKNKVYGDQQSENTDNAPILKRLLYRAHERNYYETAQESPQARYDVAQPGTSNQKRDIMGPQVEIIEKQPDLEKSSNLAISWKDGRAQNPSIPIRKKIPKNRHKSPRTRKKVDMLPETTQHAHPGCSTSQMGQRIPRITKTRQNSNQKAKIPRTGKGKKLAKNQVRTTPPMMTITQSAEDIDKIVSYLAKECMKKQVEKSWYLYQGTREQIEWDITLKLHPPEEKRNNQTNNNDSSISHPSNENTNVNSNISELRSLRCVPEENRLKTLRIKSDQ